jgi:sulfate adenylyltransferase subunit 1
VAEVRHAGLTVDRCEAGQSAGFVLDRQVDVSRGDWIVTPASAQPRQEFSATLAWLDTEPAVIGRKYWVRHGHRWVQARITGIDHRIDIHTLQNAEASELKVNEIGIVTLQTQAALPVEPYAANRVGGALIIVDPTTNRTSGALLVGAVAAQLAAA